MDNDVIDDKMKGKIKGYVSALRDDISAAFSKEEKGVFGADKYLIHLKDMEIAEKNDELAKLTRQLDKLVGFIGDEKARSISSAADILEADDLILWKQRDNGYSVETNGLSSEKGRDIFLEVIPHLTDAETDDVPTGFCSIGNFAAYMVDLQENSAVVALFVRRSFNKFSETELKIVRVISQFLATLYK
ncbi:MAG: hypothetical protein LBP51_03815 [Deferribacteraceae bacterium]|jgi:hypothetical protein|nr:hypothetical protein [Deferribacteraceae bacterium]